ncbi:hypothetical protein PENTCL1PPCAC_3812, partial [Pristionchus entomophagus]
QIGSLRSAVKDCATSLRFDHTNLKAVIRGAECLLGLSYASNTLQWIDSALKGYDGIDDGEPLLKTITHLRAKAEKEEEGEERDRRKKRSE